MKLLNDQQKELIIFQIKFYLTFCTKVFKQHKKIHAGTRILLNTGTLVATVPNVPNQTSNKSLAIIACHW